MEFEWDEAKNEANIAKHGISFERARSIFDSIYIKDEIDFSDIPELTEKDFKNAQVVRPGDEQVSLWLSKRVLDYFRGQGPNVVAQIEAVLKAYVEERANV